MDGQRDRKTDGWTNRVIDGPKEQWMDKQTTVIL